MAEPRAFIARRSCGCPTAAYWDDGTHFEAALLAEAIKSNPISPASLAEVQRALENWGNCPHVPAAQAELFAGGVRNGSQR